uniref:UDP-glycosyltransferase 13 n=1 Tax=Pueraria montana var. lobata TaxID=3893 RepID=UGT13_PUEML|nr:RecName: Full=UDP-glycosyltransferase 13; Short=PlUGT13; AltName: Full=Glycosyltransferase UGT88H1; AltName: Full=UDP-glucose:isoflavone 7-O-glucosyltransferase KGT13 [Pueraria montana var. lobata]AGZ84546.1 UDP-glucose:isoflavone 7-O-glucosyltransferase KGT13 [Pueraria montana var. lobata]
MKGTIVLYPAMGRGHIVPMVELGKFLSTHHHATLSVKILLPSPPNSTTLRYITAVSAATPSITFLHLSPSQHLLRVLQTLISQSSKPKAFILDFFNHSAADVTQTLNIPTYYYFPNAASCVALMLYTPTIHHNTKNGNSSYNDTLRRIPGLPPLSPEDMPAPLLDRRSFESFANMSIQMRKSDGIIVNTFEKLENKAFLALKNGTCVSETSRSHSSTPETRKPRIFCVGPLVSNGGGEHDNDDSGCMSWLDLQPSRTVVFLSFGSYGRFSKSQIREIALGLERSGQRFLWVVRDPYERSELSLEELLPKGFLERTKERGMVVKNWAPQVKVLSHDSVGGFVTHCGWNSVLEAVSWGVPMVAWPLYAEQRLNRVVMVEEMKVALPLKEVDEDGFVRASELEERVRELMDSERGRGKEVRKRVLGATNDAVAALSDGGSSRIELNDLVGLWMQ